MRRRRMMLPPRDVQALLGRLLDKYEASGSYGRPGPWPRAMILKFDEATFPDAFAPEGAEARASLLATARTLAARGALGMVLARGVHRADEPTAFRLEPAHVAPAYHAVRDAGYQPLAAAAAALAAALGDTPPGAPDWWRRARQAILAAVTTGDLAPLHTSPSTFKDRLGDVRDALRAADRLAAGVDGWERHVSGAIFQDTKRLGQIRGRVEGLLAEADPRWEGLEAEERGDLLEHYGVRRRPPVLRLAGALVACASRSRLALDDLGPEAALPAWWTAALACAAAAAKIRQVTTIENEYPYFAYVEEAEGPRGLGARGELVVYTAGFPGSATLRLLQQLAAACPDAAFRHWGDADAGGLRIWWHLRRSLGRPVALYRTDPAWFAGLAPDTGQPLTAADRARLTGLLSDLTETALDIQTARTLAEALLAAGRKVEQERF